MTPASIVLVGRSLASSASQPKVEGLGMLSSVEERHKEMRQANDTRRRIRSRRV
ncbi:hypothetical protein BDW59DRAFT_154771 [Aspergillus cavernicola]|uniref:Uncharacterized protein n=1 Tax=Aspergillus cavernicola TaxID=176166 RepID=A0ABR4HFU0_9EURO